MFVYSFANFSMTSAWTRNGGQLQDPKFNTIGLPDCNKSYNLYSFFPSKLTKLTFGASSPTAIGGFAWTYFLMVACANVLSFGSFCILPIKVVIAPNIMRNSHRIVELLSNNDLRYPCCIQRRLPRAASQVHGFSFQVIRITIESFRVIIFSLSADAGSLARFVAFSSTFWKQLIRRPYFLIHCKLGPGATNGVGQYCENGNRKRLRHCLVRVNHTYVYAMFNALSKVSELRVWRRMGRISLVCNKWRSSKNTIVPAIPSQSDGRAVGNRVPLPDDSSSHGYYF